MNILNDLGSLRQIKRSEGDDEDKSQEDLFRGKRVGAGKGNNFNRLEGDLEDVKGLFSVRAHIIKRLMPNWYRNLL